MLLLHLVSRAEETMPLFVSSFKHFHGPLPAGPHQWPAQAETGKVSLVFACRAIPPYSGISVSSSGDVVGGHLAYTTQLSRAVEEPSL